MAEVLLTAYLLIVLALIGVILLQRSEGGALGIGGGNNNFMTTRGTGNVLTRTTAILAALFFVLAISLTILAEFDRPSGILLDSSGEGVTEPTSILDALNQIQGDDAGLPVPVTPADSAPLSEETADPALAVPDAPAAQTPVSPVEAPAVETAPAGATPADNAAGGGETPATPAAPAN